MQSPEIPTHRSPNLELELAVQIRKQMVQAMSDFQMLEEGDRLMVCVSGGKDSSILLALLSEVQRRAPYNFEFEAVMLDQKQPGFDARAFEAWVHSLGVKLTILERDTYSIVTEKITDGTYCSLCSRLRRGILYDYAHENKFTKMALGHHRNDLMETLMMNMFYTGTISAMPPKLLSDDQRNVVIRPLCYVAEKDLIALSKIWNFPVVPCNLCGSQENMKRKKMKNLLNDLEKDIPFLSNSMLKAMSNVHESQLMDQSLWDFEALRVPKASPPLS